MHDAPDPIGAVTAPFPSHAYRDLAGRESLVWSDLHAMWIAAHPVVVHKVLESTKCRVRPREMPVPAHLNGTTAGTIFGRWARMREGDDHGRVKAALIDGLDAIDQDVVRAAAELAAMSLLDDRSRFAFDVPVVALGQMIGVSEDHLPELATWVGDFVRGLAPGASDGHIATGQRAAESLWRLVSAILAGEGAGPLTVAVRRAFDHAGLDHDTTVANLIGLLFQAHDAVAGLIGSAVVRLARAPETFSSTGGLLEDVLRIDAPIQNTRRFVAEDAVIAGQEVREGDQVLVVIAGPAGACPFGHGRHACPGQEMAMTIAETATAFLIRAGFIPELPENGVAYAPSANARIPLVNQLTAGDWAS